jgi:hypothetical protein
VKGRERELFWGWQIKGGFLCRGGKPRGEGFPIMEAAGQGTVFVSKVDPKDFLLTSGLHHGRKNHIEQEKGQGVGPCVKSKRVLYKLD